MIRSIMNSQPAKLFRPRARHKIFLRSPTKHIASRSYIQWTRIRKTWRKMKNWRARPDPVTICLWRYFFGEKSNFWQVTEKQYTFIIYVSETRSRNRSRSPSRRSRHNLVGAGAGVARNGLLGAGAGAVKNGAAPAPKRDAIAARIKQQQRNK